MELAHARIKYNEELFGVHYLSIEDFVKELPRLGELSDFIEKNSGKVIAVIPNSGITWTSFYLGLRELRASL